MPANTTPIYSRLGDIQWGTTLTTANTAKDGTGTVVIFFTADATNGGMVDKIRIKALGTNVATVLRVFINNGSDPTVAANNCLYTEVTCAATTLSETAALASVDIPNAYTVSDQVGFPIVLPPGYRLTATIGTSVAAGLRVTAVGGKY